MSAIREAAESLVEALEGIDELHVHTDLGAVLDPPAVVVSPPRLTRATNCLDFTDATFLVIVAVAADDLAVERLWDLVPVVSAAIEEHTNGAVTTASPGLWTGGGAELPCYEITVEMPL